MKIVSRNTINRELEAFCDRFGTFNDAAEKLGVTASQLSATRRDPSYPVPQRILDKLGYGTATVYVAKADVPAKDRKVKKAKPVAKPKAEPVAKPKAKPITKADLINPKIKVKAVPKSSASAEKTVNIGINAGSVNGNGVFE